jgi:hypothetical protein
MTIFLLRDYSNNFMAFCKVFITPHNSGAPTATHKRIALAFTI